MTTLASCIVLGGVTGALSWLAKKVVADYIGMASDVLSLTKEVTDYLDGNVQPETIVSDKHGRSSRKLELPRGASRKLSASRRAVQLRDFDSCTVPSSGGRCDTTAGSGCESEGGAPEAPQREEAGIKPAFPGQEDYEHTDQDERGASDAQSGAALQAVQEPDSGAGLDSGAEGETQSGQDGDTGLQDGVSRPKRQEDVPLYAGSTVVSFSPYGVFPANFPMTLNYSVTGKSLL